MNRLIITIFLLLTASVGLAQNGRILSKTLVDLSATRIWTKISQNDSLKTEFEHLNNIDFYFISYQSDSLEVRGILVEPKKEGKYPVVIFNRGGNRDFTPLNISTLINYTSKLANQGFIIIGSNYREKDEFGGAELNDVLNLTETVKYLDKADPNCIGMFGWSRGGIMTYLSLKESDKIKTAIVGNGVTDLFQLIADRPKMETGVLAECIPNYWKNKDLELKKRSAIFWANKLNENSSLLILASKEDKRANPEQAEKFAQKLTDLKYNFELRTFQTDHFFTGKRNELDELVINWFNEKLKNYR